MQLVAEIGLVGYLHNGQFDVIYVNGDNTLPNMRRDEEHWEVILTEEEFAKRMFEDG